MNLRKLKVWLAVAVVTFSLGLLVTIQVRKPAKLERSSTEKLTLIIPEASWERIFFKPINAVTSLTGQGELRKTILKNGDHEVRIWWGFGLSPLEGLLLRHIDGNWSAVHVKADHYYEPTKATKTELKPPQAGWDATWKQLLDAGILKLPDASEIECGGGGMDGLSVVVEIQIDHTYRTYMYPNPSLERCDEAKQVVKLTELIWNALPTAESRTHRRLVAD